MTLFSFFESLFCKDHLIEIEDLKEKVIEKSKQNLAQAESIAKDLKQIEDLEEENNELISEVRKLISNVPIIYSGRGNIKHSWTHDKKSFQIPLQNFVQPNLVQVHELLKKKDLYIFNKSEFNEKVPKIYRALKSLVSYRNDSTQFDRREYWLTANEVLARGYGDCEDSCNLIVSGLEASGVSPEDVYVMVGEANNGIGHATVSVRGTDNVLRHLNSTTPTERFDSLIQFPEFKVKNTNFRTNSWNLKEIWFGYNSLISFDNFDMPSSYESYIIKQNEKPDAIQFNDYTELKNRVYCLSGGVQVPVRNCIVQIEGRVYTANKGGVVDIKIPDSLVGKPVHVRYYKDGYKDRVFTKTFSKGKTTSFAVRMYKGSL